MRRGQPSGLRRVGSYHAHLRDERRIDAVEQLSDEILDRIDAIVPPGSDIGRLDMAYNPPAVVQATLRRRPIDARTAA